MFAGDSRKPSSALTSHELFGMAFLAMLTLYLFVRGWACWTLSVCGDNALDVSDALRFYHGDHPYRDFIPFYGGFPLLLHFLILTLSRGQVPSLWIFYGMLSLCVTLWLFFFWKRRTNLLGGLGVGLLFLTISAYSPFNNNNWPMPYSYSGVLGPVLIVIQISLLHQLKRGCRCVRHVFAIALICGVLPTIKTDYAGAALATGLLLALWTWKRLAEAIPAMVAGFILPAFTLQVLYGWILGASFRQIWNDPLVEAFLLSDNANTYQYTLRFFLCILTVGAIDVMGRLGLRFASFARIAMAFFFSLLPFLDVVETLSGRRDVPFQFVFVKYGVIALCYWSMLREGMLWIWSMLKQRQFIAPSLFFMLSTLAAASVFRAFVIGFYTVPYVFVILLIVAVTQALRWVPYGLIRFGWTCCFALSVSIAAVVSLFSYPKPNEDLPQQWVKSRFGIFKIFSSGNETYNRERTTLINIMNNDPLGTPILAGPWAEMYVVGGQTSFGTYEGIYKLCILKEHDLPRQRELVEQMQEKHCSLVLLDSTKFKDAYGDVFGPTSCPVLYDYLDREFERDTRFHLFQVYWRKTTTQKASGKERI